MEQNPGKKISHLPRFEKDSGTTPYLVARRAARRRHILRNPAEEPPLDLHEALDDFHADLRSWPETVQVVAGFPKLTQQEANVGHSEGCARLDPYEQVQGAFRELEDGQYTELIEALDAAGHPHQVVLHDDMYQRAT